MSDIVDVHGDQGLSPAGKRTLWIVMILGLIGAGTAFALKLAEFMYTLSSDAVKGFADVPVTVYFMVAGGWFAVLMYCFATGKFKNVEQAKYDMLAKEEEYDRTGQ